MLKTLSLVVLTLSTLVSYGQTESDSVRKEVDFRSYLTYTRVMGKKQPPPDGFFLPNSGFTNGIIYIGPDLVSYDVPMRYNKIADVIEVKLESEVFELRPQIGEFEFELGPLLLVCRQYKLHGTGLVGFFELIQKGRVSLLRKDVIRDKSHLLSDDQGTSKVAGNITRTWSTYLTSDPRLGPHELSFDDFVEKHYYVQGRELPAEVKSLKYLTKSLPANEEVLKEYATENKLRNNEEGYAALISYYNQLTGG